MRFAAVFVLLCCALPVAAQQGASSDSYRDARAGELVRLARARRAVVDTRITTYEATAHERFSAHLAVAGFERLLFRRETAARIQWTRDTVRIEVLGAREAQPLSRVAPQLPPPDIAGLMPSLAFDPVNSEMLLRVDSTLLQHPLAPGSEAYYRFSSGDSTSIRLPDGRTVRLLELRIAARRPDPRLINGSFWVDAETHAVVRAGFRLSRSRPAVDSRISVVVPELTAELDHIAIDFGLWDLRWWLPRTVVARGVVRIAGTRLPIAYERRYEGYRVQGDANAAVPPTEDAAARMAERPCRPRGFGSIAIGIGAPEDSAARDSAWNAAWNRSAERVAAGDTTRSGTERRCDRAFIVTRAEGVDLVSSPVFTADVYAQGEGPVAPEELRELLELLRGVPDVAWGLGRPSVQLLTTDLVRFNRVEGLSLGARAVLPLGPAELRGELRAGTTGEIGARLSGVRSSSTLRSGAAVYRGTEAVAISSQPFSLASSLGALLLGRDENDYFRGTGAELRFSPPLARRQGWSLRIFAERQEPVGRRSGVSLRGLIDDGFETRENLAAEPLYQAGATLRLRGSTGDDPARLRARAELELHGETGDRTFVRPLARLGVDGLLNGSLGYGLSLAAGTGLGDAPVQRWWQIGGATTVRGHDAAALRGQSLWLGRAEINWGNPSARLAVFGDAGWAGAAQQFLEAQPVRGAGVGAALFDNLLRLDLARGIGGGGYRLHLRVGAGL